ncbi:MAG: HAMP domain-containing protein [Betaproteobacteria bacterium]
MNTDAATAHPAAQHPPPRHANMSLRLKINLIFSGLTVVIFAVLLAVEIAGTRASVREEMEASNRIATQLLGRISHFYSHPMMPELVAFLRDTGRVRANDIRLYDQSGQLLYVSPPSQYKAGRDAPAWYAAFVMPPLSERSIELDGARLVLTANPTRAILDGWDNLSDILFSQFLLLLLADLLLFWLVGRWLAPLERVERGLREIEQGDHHVRLPPLKGKEAGEMGRAFNRMAQAVEDNIQVRQASAEAQARLDAQREFTTLLHARIEEERAAIARELHDELGQSLTAIRSIAKSMMQHPVVAGGPLERHASMLFDTAGKTSDAMRRLIPRLRPIQLEGMGLIDAIRDLLTETQQNHPEVRFELSVAEEGLPTLDDQLELSAYRIVQEAVTNIVRHSGASRATVTLAVEHRVLKLAVADNGKGAESMQREGHYGVRGMQERAEAFGGDIAFGRSTEGGLAVHVSLPLGVVDEETDEKNN